MILHWNNLYKYSGARAYEEGVGVQSVHRSGTRRAKNWEEACELVSEGLSHGRFILIGGGGEFSTISSLFRKIIMENSLSLMNSGSL